MKNSPELDALTAEVERTDTVIDSAITLITGLAQALKDAGTDPTALAALTASLEARASALADAVVANTPDAPPAG
jgi:hypothetical protein